MIGSVWGAGDSARADEEERIREERKAREVLDRARRRAAADRRDEQVAVNRHDEMQRQAQTAATSMQALRAAKVSALAARMADDRSDAAVDATLGERSAERTAEVQPQPQPLRAPAPPPPPPRLEPTGHAQDLRAASAPPARVHEPAPPGAATPESAVLEDAVSGDAGVLHQRSAALQAALGELKTARLSARAGDLVQRAAASAQRGEEMQRLKAELDFIEEFHVPALTQTEERAALMKSLVQARAVLVEEALAACEPADVAWVSQSLREARDAARTAERPEASPREAQLGCDTPGSLNDAAAAERPRVPRLLHGLNEAERERMVADLEQRCASMRQEDRRRQLLERLLDEVALQQTMPPMPSSGGVPAPATSQAGEGALQKQELRERSLPLIAIRAA